MMLMAIPSSSTRQRQRMVTSRVLIPQISICWSDYLFFIIIFFFLKTMMMPNVNTSASSEDLADQNANKDHKINNDNESHSQRKFLLLLRSFGGTRTLILLYIFIFYFPTL